MPEKFSVRKKVRELISQNQIRNGQDFLPHMEIGLTFQNKIKIFRPLYNNVVANVKATRKVAFCFLAIEYLNSVGEKLEKKFFFKSHGLSKKKFQNERGPVSLIWLRPSRWPSLLWFHCCRMDFWKGMGEKAQSPKDCVFLCDILTR